MSREVEMMARAAAADVLLDESGEEGGGGGQLIGISSGQPFTGRRARSWKSFCCPECTE